MNAPREIILGIGGYLGHDANAALVIDGRLIAASQEERFTRRKHDGIFPARAIADCLALGGVSPAEVTACVFGEKPFQTTFFDLGGALGNALTRWLGRRAPESVAGLCTPNRRGDCCRMPLSLRLATQLARLVTAQDQIALARLGRKGIITGISPHEGCGAGWHRGARRWWRWNTRRWNTATTGWPGWHDGSLAPATNFI